MTHSTPDDDPVELTRAVSDLAVMVERQSAVLAQLSDETRANSAQTDVNSAQTDVNTAQSVKNTSSNRRHRIALTAGALGLVFDLVLSGYFWHLHIQQKCRDHRSATFFTAERAKVCGQIAGIEQIAPPDEAKAKRITAVCGGTPATATDIRAGVDRFESASLAYVETISQVKEKC